MMEEDIQFKFWDMRNTCNFDNLYSDKTQTREYRLPKVIIAWDYNEAAD